MTKTLDLKTNPTNAVKWMKIAFLNLIWNMNIH